MINVGWWEFSCGNIAATHSHWQVAALLRFEPAACIYEVMHSGHPGLSDTPLFYFSVVLPHLHKLALVNNMQTVEAKRLDVASQLFEAYSALSCCCILQGSRIQGLGRRLNSCITSIFKIGEN